MQEPWSLCVAARADGTWLTYTFNREDNVTAWARHNMGNSGLVESLAVIPAPDALRDEVWFIVNRTVNGQIIRTVEYLVKQFEGPQAGQMGDAPSSAWYVDCGVQYQAPPTCTLTGVSIAFGTFYATATYFGANTFSAGQTVLVSGIAYTGDTNPNGVWVLSSATPGSFVVRMYNVVGFSHSFAYTSRGTAAANNATGSTTVNGLPAVMWNQTVSVLADGGVQPQQVVSSSGSITLPGTFNLVTVGFPYQGNLVPMRPEGGADVGTAQGKLKDGNQTVIRLVDSGGLQMGFLSNQNVQTQIYQDPLGLTTITPPALEYVQLNYTSTGLDAPPPIQSGDFPVSNPSAQASDQDARDYFMLVQQNNPLPATVVGLYPNYQVQEPQ
jgi:hypothetical protein